MDKAAADRIAAANKGNTEKGSFEARAQVHMRTIYEALVLSDIDINVCLIPVI